MPLKSTDHRYGTVAITIHWVSAVAILGLLTSGLIAGGLTDDAAKAGILRVHVALGSAIVALTVLRVLWWWLADRRPQPLTGMPLWQERAASAVHGLLYVCILVVGGSGIAMVALSGALPIIYGAAPLPLPDFNAFAPRMAHGLVARIMIVLLIGHIGAALWHQLVRRDRLLARMGLGRTG